MQVDRVWWFQIHHRITIATIQNPTLYLLGARVSIFSALVPRLIGYYFKKMLLLFSVTIEFVLANRTDPDGVLHYLVNIWVLPLATNVSV